MVTKINADNFIRDLVMDSEENLFEKLDERDNSVNQVAELVERINLSD